MPTAESDCMARSRQVLSSRPWNLSARRKFSSTVYHGSNVLSWNTKAMSFGRGRSTGSPATVTVPAVGASAPPVMSSSQALAAGGGPEQADKLALPDFERYIVERQHALRGVASDEIHRDMIDHDAGRTHGSALCGIGRRGLALGAHVQIWTGTNLSL